MLEACLPGRRCPQLPTTRRDRGSPALAHRVRYARDFEDSREAIYRMRRRWQTGVARGLIQSDQIDVRWDAIEQGHQAARLLR